ncbi:Holin of 3TMs, for gene-transfer release [uncultured Caudovirales phage]|uniref:Holin of 3TMs, for gene-transfer release n=1 Tax=uncultured Caudovirales phage TaxID=2100421 RepID=A0A6J5R795_9CAUD|nr:Holin of 3TMs, for gene-transfer release [uncultured Caudovirales phage]
MIGLDAILGIGGKLIEKLIPDPAAQDAARLELLKLQQSGELAAMTAQTEINKAEASNPSVFVSGWRPAIGWVCALAMGYQYLARPLMVAFMPALTFQGLDDNLWQLMTGMLGLGGLRTFEKTQGVASK